MSPFQQAREAEHGIAVECKNTAVQTGYGFQRGQKHDGSKGKRDAQQKRRVGFAHTGRLRTGRGLEAAGAGDLDGIHGNGSNGLGAHDGMGAAGAGADHGGHGDGVMQVGGQGSGAGGHGVGGSGMHGREGGSEGDEQGSDHEDRRPVAGLFHRVFLLGGLK